MRWACGAVPGAGCFAQTGLHFTLGPAEPLLWLGCPLTAAWPHRLGGTQRPARMPVCPVLGPGGWAGCLLFFTGPLAWMSSPRLWPQHPGPLPLQQHALAGAGVSGHPAPTAGVCPGGCVHPGRPRGRARSVLRLCIIGSGLHLPSSRGHLLHPLFPHPGGLPHLHLLSLPRPAPSLCT